MPEPAASLRAYMDDGFSTKIAFAGAPGIGLYEKTIKPSGRSGGGPIDTTTMRNIRFRTQSPKHLITVSAVEFQAAYYPQTHDSIRAQIQINQLITLTFPDGETWTHWGWLEEFMPGDHVEGEMPLAACKVEFSNVDEFGEEIGPVADVGR